MSQSRARTAPRDNPTALSNKLAWVKAHPGEACRKRLILSHNKHLNRGDFLVDDRPNKGAVDDRPNNGAKDFPGELTVFGSEAFPDWDAVLPYLRQRA